MTLRRVADIRINGLTELSEVLKTLPGDIEKEADKTSMQKVVKALQRDVRSRIHNVTGTLSARIKTEVKVEKDRVSGKVISTAPHTHLVEYGHRLVRTSGSNKDKVRTYRVIGYVPPYPFLRPALYENVPNITDEVIRGLTAAVEDFQNKKL